MRDACAAHSDLRSPRMRSTCPVPVPVPDYNYLDLSAVVGPSSSAQSFTNNAGGGRACRSPYRSMTANHNQEER